MSGVMAIVSMDGKPVPPGLASEQLASIACRGDWEPQLWMGDGIALGHANRPTTLEAEREFLPASDAGGRFWLTWDGRLDNRDELASDLGIMPTDAARWTDADFVLAAFRKWGDGCTTRLLGDWAVVIWDAQMRRLFCARDPLGYRQLFFARANGMFLVGADPLQLFAGGYVPSTPNWEYVHRLVSDAVQDLNTTCYEHIRILEGGQSLVVASGRETITTYWDGYQPVDRTRTVDDFAEEFEHLFGIAVQARLRTNRKIGVNLSGGLDSSYVTAVAAQMAPLHALTAYAPGTERMDERVYAELVANHCGVQQTLVDVSDCWGLSSHWLPNSAFDQAPIPPQAATQVKLAATASDLDLGVILTGEGADEWMTGNANIATALAEVGPRGAVAAARQWSARSRLQRSGRQLYRGFVPPRLRSAVRGLRHDAGSTPAGLVPWQAQWEPLDGYLDVPATERRERYLRFLHLYRTAAKEVIPWRERHALSPGGIEVRTPFNDRRLAELMARTPAAIKNQGGKSKALLRLAEARVLPGSIAARTDHGLYDELLGTTMVEREQARIFASVDGLHQLPGIRADSLAAFQPLGQELRLVSRWAWSALAAGLWLTYLGITGAEQASASDDPNLSRKEVML